MYNKVIRKIISNKREELTSKNLFKKNAMYTFIRIEYLAANALVELYEKNRTSSISFENIIKYGISVEEILNKNADTKAILLYSNIYAKEFAHDYSNLFEVTEEEIKIKDGVSIDQIREHILSYLSMDILNALLSQEALSVINAA